MGSQAGKYGEPGWLSMGSQAGKNGRECSTRHFHCEAINRQVNMDGACY